MGGAHIGSVPLYIIRVHSGCRTYRGCLRMHEDGHVVLALWENGVLSCCKADVAHSNASFLQDLHP